MREIRRLDAALRLLKLGAVVPRELPTIRSAAHAPTPPPQPRFDASAALKAALAKVMNARSKPEANAALAEGFRSMQPVAKTAPLELVRAKNNLLMAYQVRLQSLDRFEDVRSIR